MKMQVVDVRVICEARQGELIAKQMVESFSNTALVLHHSSHISDADDALRKKIRHGVILKQKDLNLISTDHREGFIKVLNKNHELIAVLSHDLKKNELTYCCVFEK